MCFFTTKKLFTGLIYKMILIFIKNFHYFKILYHVLVSLSQRFEILMLYFIKQVCIVFSSIRNWCDVFYNQESFLYAVFYTFTYLLKVKHASTFIALKNFIKKVPRSCRDLNSCAKFIKSSYFPVYSQYTLKQ